MTDNPRITTKNKAKVTWKKVKKATGYEIQYTTKGFGNKKDTKTIKVSKAKITSAQLKKLKKKTRSCFVLLLEKTKQTIST